jgi:hypothetical protein
VLTGPASGAVKFERRASNGAPVSRRLGIGTASAVRTTTAATNTTLDVTLGTGNSFTDGDVMAIMGTAGPGQTEYNVVSSHAADVVTPVRDIQGVHTAGATDLVYDLGAPLATTAVTADPAASATALSVVSTSGMAVGDSILVTGNDAAHAEIKTIVSLNATTINVSALSGGAGDHTAATVVYDLGAGNTEVRTANSAGVTTLAIQSSTGLAVGDQLLVGGATPELATISAVNAGPTVTLAEPLAAVHALYAPVVKLRSTSPDGFASVPVETSRQVVNNASGSSSDPIYLAATQPGTYTVQFYKDRNGNSTYDSTQDDATPVFTLDVKDVNTTTGDAADDLSPSLSVVASTDQGQAITPTVTTGLTTVDTRGVNGSSVGVLGTKIASASQIKFEGAVAGVDAVYAPGSFNGTSVYLTSAASSGSGTETTTFAIGSGITRTGTTVFSASTVTRPVLEDVTNVAGSVKDAAGAIARVVHVKPGVAAVTYKATTEAAGPVVVAGARVYFTLTTGTNSPALTADGTLISSGSTTKVYAATTGSDGIATLVVTSGTTTNGTTYKVDFSSGNQVGDQLTATYETPAASSIDITNSQASLLVTPGQTATLTGRLLDQFDGAYTPTGTAPLQVAVRMPAGGTTVGQAAFSGNAFSYTYTPSTTPTAGSSTSWDFNYDPGTLNLDGTDSTINWASATNPSAVTITSPLSTSTPTQEKGSATIVAGTNITGLVQDGTNAAMPYKLVTLTGSEGVYFSTVASPTTAATDDLATTLTVATNGAGVYNAYAFFTKAGTSTVTVASGTTATQHVDVAVTQNADPYQVIAVDTAVGTGSTSVVTGRVKNAWGFPVSGATVNLSLGSSTAAALGNSTVTTSADGVWSTTVTGSNGDGGEATLTATVNGDTANRTANAAWLDNAGLTIAHGEYQDQATITVDPTINQTTVSVPASHAAGAVQVTGKAKPNSTVEIYSKPTGTQLAYALVGVAAANANGDWSDTEYLTRTTTFYAKTSVSSSAPVTVVVTNPANRASVKASAKAMGKGVVKVSVNGAPNRKGTITIYVNGSKVRTMTSNAAGDGTVSLKVAKGKKTIKVIFAPSGYASAASTVTVTVK